IGQCVLLGAAGGAILLASYFFPTDSALLRRIPRVARALGDFRVAIRSLPTFPLSALGWLVLGRLSQVLLIAVLAHAVGAAFSVACPFIAQAVLLIGATVGDVIPGQIGAFEAAFSVSAAAMGLTRSNAVAVALLIHLVQAAWVVVGFGAVAPGRAKAQNMR